MFFSTVRILASILRIATLLNRMDRPIKILSLGVDVKFTLCRLTFSNVLVMA